MEVIEKEIFEIVVNFEIRVKEVYEKFVFMIKSDIIRDEFFFLVKEEDKYREIIEKMVECFVVEGGELKKIEMEVMGEFKVIVEKMVEVIKKFDINFDEIYEIVM